MKLLRFCSLSYLVGVTLNCGILGVLNLCSMPSHFSWLGFFIGLTNVFVSVFGVLAFWARYIKVNQTVYGETIRLGPCHNWAKDGF